MSGMSAREIGRALDLKRGRGNCPICGNSGTLVLLTRRDGPPLPWCHYGCKPRDLRDAIGKVIGGEIPTSRVRDPAAETKREQTRQRAIRLWSTGRQAAGTIVATYLAKRALPRLEISTALRFGPDTPHPTGGWLPALLALVTSVDGTPVGVHRTFLAGDGRKAAIDPAKASLGAIWGGAIRLDPEAPEMVIGEGVETAASAGRLLSLPAWAALNAGNLGRGLMLPRAVRSIVIATDRDTAGEQATRQAAERWQAEGRQVRIAVPKIGNDFNDVLRARAEADHAA